MLEMKASKDILPTRKGKGKAGVETKVRASLQEAYLELSGEMLVVAQYVSTITCQVVIKHQLEELAKRGATFVSNLTVSKGISFAWLTRTKCPAQGDD